MNLAQIERSLRQCLEESEVESRQQIASGLDESVWRDSPPALLPYQQRWVADESPIKVIEKSRRVGLSWSEACASVLEAAKQNGRSTIYCSYNFDMTENFIKDCAFWAKHFQLAASAIEEVMLNNGDDDILTYQIRFASGYTIKALSGKPNNIRGKQARVVIDEAAFCQDLPELIKSAIALLMWGGQIRILSTHNGETNAFNQLVQQIEAKELDYSLHRVTLDDALADGLYKRICLIQGIEWTLEANLRGDRS
jgi:phage FluMu gp28-like protein